MGDEFRSTYLVENRLQMRVRHTAFYPERMYLEKLKIVFFEVAIVSHVCDIENAKTKIATKCVFFNQRTAPACADVLQQCSMEMADTYYNL